MRQRVFNKLCCFLFASSSVSAFTFLPGRGSFLGRRHAAIPVDVVDAVVVDHQQEHLQHDAAADTLARQHEEWEADMKEMQMRLEQRVHLSSSTVMEDVTPHDGVVAVAAAADPFVISENLPINTTRSVATAPATVEAIDAMVIEHAEEPTTATIADDVVTMVETNEATPEEAVKKDITAVPHLYVTEPLKSANEQPLLELTTSGVSSMDQLTAKLATAHRTIATLTQENLALKKARQENTLLMQQQQSQQPKGSRNWLRRVTRRMGKKKPNNNNDDDDEQDENRLLVELTHDTLELDSVVRLSMLLATAQRILQVLLTENRDLKCTLHHSAPYVGSSTASWSGQPTAVVV